jgi:hypothetical protein
VRGVPEGVDLLDTRIMVPYNETICKNKIQIRVNKYDSRSISHAREHRYLRFLAVPAGYLDS